MGLEMFAETAQQTLLLKGFSVRAKGVAVCSSDSSRVSSKLPVLQA